MKYLSLAVLCAAACVEGGGSTETNHEDASEVAAMEAQALALVREFSDDEGARFEIASATDEGFCGTVIVRGERKKAYVDLVDGEAFIASGSPAFDLVIDGAC